MHWGYYRSISDAHASEMASRAESKATTLQGRLKVLEDRIDSLALVCQGMWELLSESVPDAEMVLANKIEEIDLRDGKLDGKMNRVHKTCPRCDRPLHQRHLKCIYCGEGTYPEHVFQS